MKVIRKSSENDFPVIQDILSQAQLSAEQVPGCDLQFYLLETKDPTQLCGLLGYQQCTNYGVLRGFVLTGSLTEEEMFQFFDEVIRDIENGEKELDGIYMVSVHESMFPFFQYFGFSVVPTEEVELQVLGDGYVRNALLQSGAQILRKSIA